MAGNDEAKRAPGAREYRTRGESIRERPGLLPSGARYWTSPGRVRIAGAGAPLSTVSISSDDVFAIAEEIAREYRKRGEAFDAELWNEIADEVAADETIERTVSRLVGEEEGKRIGGLAFDEDSPLSPGEKADRLANLVRLATMALGEEGVAEVRVEHRLGTRTVEGEDGESSTFVDGRRTVALHINGGVPSKSEEDADEANRELAGEVARLNRLLAEEQETVRRTSTDTLAFLDAVRTKAEELIREACPPKPASRSVGDLGIHGMVEMLERVAGYGNRAQGVGKVRIEEAERYLREAAETPLAHESIRAGRIADAFEALAVASPRTADTVIVPCSLLEQAARIIDRLRVRRAMRKEGR